jgi:hypothetical protein
VKALGDLKPTNIGLYAKNGDQTDVVQVGEPWEKVRSVFPEKRGAYNLNDLPPRFPADEYEVHGWESGSGEGFGVILNSENKVVAAMYHLEQAKEDTVQEKLEDQKAGVGAGPKNISGKSVQYWFWHLENQTLMVCAFQKGKEYELTLAMGDDGILKALGISEEDAQRDQRILDTKPPTAGPTSTFLWPLRTNRAQNPLG